MPEIDEILSRLTERHHVSLQRFASHLHEERAWPGTLSYGTLLASKARNTLNKGSEGVSGGYWGSFAEILRPPGLFSQMCRPLIALRRGRCNL